MLIIMGWVYISSVKKAKSLNSTVTSTSVEIKSYISDEGNTNGKYYSINIDSTTGATSNPTTW